MKELDFYISWVDEFAIVGEINWTKPYTHDLLFSGNIEDDDEAYFYSIVAFKDKEWWPYYIGMVFEQTISERLNQPDHKKRLENLRKKYPSLNFTVSLGTPSFNKGKVSQSNISAVEGLLIYSNWHDDMVNERKISKFSSLKQIYIKNTGFIEHLHEEIVYGVLYRN